MRISVVKPFPLTLLALNWQPQGLEIKTNKIISTDFTCTVDIWSTLDKNMKHIYPSVVLRYGQSTGRFFFMYKPQKVFGF
jgi:hypothetical protein